MKFLRSNAWFAVLELFDREDTEKQYSCWLDQFRHFIIIIILIIISNGLFMLQHRSTCIYTNVCMYKNNPRSLCACREMIVRTTSALTPF